MITRTGVALFPQCLKSIPRCPTSTRVDGQFRNYLQAVSHRRNLSHSRAYADEPDPEPCGCASTNRSCTHTKSISPIPSQSTFHRRPLPEHCIAFSSPRGQDLFASCLRQGGLKSYFILAEVSKFCIIFDQVISLRTPPQNYNTQSEPAFCGIGTLTVCLNALGLDPGRTWKGPWRW